MAVFAAVVSVSVSYYLRGPNIYGPSGGSLLAAELAATPTAPLPPVEFTVMTLNAAHGRANGVHQALLNEEAITANLEEIASVLNELSPDIVAFQEADGPSLWSGGFDHVDYLADTSGYDHTHRGNHVSGLQLNYGTAVVSHFPLKNKASITFPANPPLFPKGFVVGEASVPGVGMVTVASVHLDFARKSVRLNQVVRLVDELVDRPRPLIVMGDFNCDWDDESTLPQLAEQLGLRAFEPDDTTITFPRLGKRLDWIFVSDEIEFVEYQVSNAELSDHRAVIARLRISDALGTSSGG